MTMPEAAFRAKRLPRSLHAPTVDDALALLEPDDEIVVYCSNVYCAASIYAYHALRRCGYTRVRRYGGGIVDWEDAGYPLEGRDAPVAATGRRRRPPRLRPALA
jgi:rhodanese-related sulfurtransferase